MFTILLAIVAGQVFDPPWLSLFRSRTFDLLQQIAPAERNPALPVRIVDIEEQSLKAYGQWPWPRSRIAELVRAIADQGGALIGFNILFPDADRLSGAKLVDSLGITDPDLMEALKGRPSNDLILSEAFLNAPVVLGVGVQNNLDKPDMGSFSFPPTVQIGPDPRPFLRSFPELLPAVDILHKTALSSGVLNLGFERDGMVRRIPVAIVARGRIVPSIALEMTRLAFGASALVIHSNATGVQNVRVGPVRIPTDRNGRIWVKYGPHSPERFVSAVDVIEGRVPPQLIKGHLILIGATAAGLVDIRSTPVEPVMSAVEIHAQFLENVLSQTFLKRPSEIRLAEASATLFMGVIYVFGLSRWSPVFSAVSLIALIAGSLGGMWYLYANENILFDGIFTVISLLLIFAAHVTIGFVIEERSKRQIRQVFGQYLSPVLVERMSQSGDFPKTGGERRPLTVLFSDVRSFTSISERFGDAPDKLTHLMNRYLTAMTEEILDYQGTIDKYIGDAVMAFWNAPLDDPEHEYHCCKAAIAMQRKLLRVNEELSSLQGSENVNTAGATRIYSEAKNIEDSNSEDALRKYREAARLGHPGAAYNIGRFYRDGTGVERDLEEAARWFQEATERGHSRAHYQLAVTLLQNSCDGKDRVVAASNLVLAHWYDIPGAKEKLEDLAQSLSREDLQHAEQRAREWKPREKFTRPIQLRSGIGINTGNCLVGNLGSVQRFNYSALGDAVNVAARLEGATKFYKIDIILGETTAEFVKEKLAVIELDRALLKGRRQPMRLFGLLGDEELLADGRFVEYRQVHENLMRAIRAQDWDLADALIRECIEFECAPKALYDGLRRRVEGFRTDPPGQEWDGVISIG